MLSSATHQLLGQLSAEGTALRAQLTSGAGGGDVVGAGGSAGGAAAVEAGGDTPVVLSSPVANANIRVPGKGVLKKARALPAGETEAGSSGPKGEVGGVETGKGPARRVAFVGVDLEEEAIAAGSEWAQRSGSHVMQSGVTADDAVSL
jgi:hypothetical protein